MARGNVPACGSRDASALETGVVPADTIRRFGEFVQTLGGDGAALCAGAGIDPALLERSQAVVPLRALAALLNRAADQLDCPDFGMSLAAFQRGSKAANLFEMVMRNSPTLGDALSYCARHVQTYSGSVSVTLDRPRGSARVFLRYELLAPVPGGQQHALELMLLCMFNIARDVTGGRFIPREVRFAHAPGAPLASYRAHFGCPVIFGQKESGFALCVEDLSIPGAESDPQLYELATFYIENRFPSLVLPTTTRVKTLVSRFLDNAEECTSDTIAARLGLHRRTMQRRLRDEGTCFETVKDEARREVALNALANSSVPLGRLAEMLGYSEISALSRSCTRWFSASPRQLRKEFATAALTAPPQNESLAPWLHRPSSIQAH